MLRKHGEFQRFVVWGSSIVDGDARVVRQPQELNIPTRATTLPYGDYCRDILPNTAPCHSAPLLPQYAESCRWRRSAQSVVSELCTLSIHTGAMEKNPLLCFHVMIRFWVVCDMERCLAANGPRRSVDSTRSVMRCTPYFFPCTMPFHRLNTGVDNIGTPLLASACRRPHNAPPPLPTPQKCTIPQQLYSGHILLFIYAPSTIFASDTGHCQVVRDVARPVGRHGLGVQVECRENGVLQTMYISKWYTALQKLLVHNGVFGCLLMTSFVVFPHPHQRIVVSSSATLAALVALPTSPPSILSVVARVPVAGHVSFAPLTAVSHYLQDA